MNNKQKIQVLVVCMLLCVLPVLKTQAQWVKSSSIINPHGQLAYPHPSAAYCSTGGGGELYKSVDSGETWLLAHDFGPFTTTQDVLFLNADTGFVVQYNRTHSTFDGGQNWQTLPDLFAPAFLQNRIRPLKNMGDTLYISAARGDTSFVFQSVDYGTTFNIIYQHIETNANPLYVSFYTNKDAYIIHPDNDSTVFVTHDGFATIDTFTYYNAHLGTERIMSFVDSNRGFFYGNTGALSYPSRLQRLSNNGVRMDQTKLDATGILPVIDMELGLQAINNRVYACSEYGKIFWSANFGQHWNEQNTPVSQRVRSIAFATPNLGIAISDDGVILTKNGGDNPNGILDQVLSNSFNLYPNPTHNTIYIKSKNSRDIKSLTLLNSMGSVIREINNADRQVDVKELSSGNYFILIHTESGSIAKPFTKR